MQNKLSRQENLRNILNLVVASEISLERIVGEIKEPKSFVIWKFVAVGELKVFM
jgi:hypothetical protein